MNRSAVEVYSSEREESPAGGQFEFRSIQPDELPPEILREFGFKVELSRVASAFVTQHADGVLTYTVVMKPPAVKDPHSYIFFVDYSDGEEAGYLRVDHSDAITYGRNTYTKEKFEKRGLGARRVIMANEYSTQNYDRVLYSGKATLSDGRRMWKSLVRRGLVEPTGGQIDHMYRFVRKVETV